MKKFLYLCVISMCAFFGLLFSGCETDKVPAGTGGNASFTLSPSSASITIQAAYKGYNPAPSRQIQVNNTGNTALTVSIAKGGTNPNDFNLSVNSLEMNASTNKSVTITPKLNLEIGQYNTALTFSANGLESKTITVNFSVVKPEDELHIYIAFGQSNMQGPGEAQAPDQTDVPERFQVLNVVGATYAYGNTVVPNVTPNNGRRVKGEWYKAVPPNIINGTNPTGSQGTRVGLSPVDYFGRTMAINTPEHITIGLIAVAHGDLALASFHKTQAATYFGSGSAGKESGRPSSTESGGWRKYTTTTETVNGERCDGGYASFYDAIVTNVKLAQEQGGIVKGIIFHQGESNRGLTYTTWQAMLKEIYDDMLSDLELEPDSIPILCGQLIHGGIGPNGVLASETTLRTGTNIPNAHLILTGGANDLPDRGDNLHFSTQSIRDLGARYANKMLELVYGITPSDN